LGELQGCHNQAAGCISLGKGWDPVSWTEYKIPDEPPNIGIKDALVICLKTDT
jgi:hypothetical protein